MFRLAIITSISLSVIFNQWVGLQEINEIFADHNVDKQYSDSKGAIAYLMADITQVTEEHIETINHRIVNTRANIKTRVLY